jgi:ribosomal protein S27AE
MPKHGHFATLRGFRSFRPSCPRCGTYVTRGFWFFGRWSCAACEWKGRSPSFDGKLIFLDESRTYECPRCHSYIRPRIKTRSYEETDHGWIGHKAQSCPKCDLELPHSLNPIPERVGETRKQIGAEKKPSIIEAIATPFKYTWPLFLVLVCGIAAAISFPRLDFNSPEAFFVTATYIFIALEAKRIGEGWKNPKRLNRTA